jgi:thiol-disulfide isomerase/thioredoxin
METIAWFPQGEIEAGLRRARQEGLALLVDFWAPGCKGCEAFEDRTYPDAAVARFVNENFVAVKYNTHQPDGEFKRLVGNSPVLWTPTLVVLTPHLREVRRVVGYLSPSEVVAELSVALGLSALLQQRPAEAAQRLDPVSRSDSPAAAEALYWLGVALYYREGRSISALTPAWEEIGARYPASTWWTRADVLSDAAVPQAV